MCQINETLAELLGRLDTKFQFSAAGCRIYMRNIKSLHPTYLSIPEAAKKLFRLAKEHDKAVEEALRFLATAGIEGIDKWE